MGRLQIALSRTGYSYKVGVVVNVCNDPTIGS